MSASSIQAQAALASAIALRDALGADGENYTVERIERLIASVRAELDTAVADLRDAHGVAAHAAVTALLEVAEALLVIGEELNTGRARVVTWLMPATGNAALAAFWRYGDVDRRAEIIALNKLPDPNAIEEGTPLRVRER